MKTNFGQSLVLVVDFHAVHLDSSAIDLLNGVTGWNCDSTHSGRFLPAVNKLIANRRKMIVEFDLVRALLICH